MQITLRAARVNSGYTVRQVAHIMGKHPSTIRRYEADCSNVSRKLMWEFMRLYRMAPDDVFFGSEAEFQARHSK